MRVDFLGSFQQVQKLIQAKGVASSQVKEFESVLQSTSDSQAVENTDKISLEQPPTTPSSTILRARYDFAKAELYNPLPETIEAPISVKQEVKEAPVSVKTPSGVSARLIKLENPFAGLTGLEKQTAVGKLVSLAGVEHGIDPALSLGVIKAESNFNPIAVSNDGHESKGLMQLLDTTGKEMMSRLGVEENYTPFDPEQNIDLGVGYLRRLHDLFQTSTELGGNLKTFAAANSSSLEKLAVAAYNAGEGRVASAQHRADKAGKDPAVYENIESYLPEITREYVKRVMSARQQVTSSNKG